MKAMILAAGFGTRLFPLTIDRTKPAIPFLGKPLVGYVAEYVAQFGFTDVVVNLHHQPQSVIDALGDGSPFGVNISYALEQPDILGTAGALDNARDHFDRETFLVINGKIITDIDISAALETHRSSGSIATMVLKPNVRREKFTAVETNGDLVRGFNGFPAQENEVNSNKVQSGLEPPLMFTGIQILEPRVFDFIPRGVYSDIVPVFYRPALERGERIAAHITDADWFELSTMTRYLDISLAMLAEGSVFFGSGFRAARSCKITDSIAWDNVTVGEDVSLHRVIIADGVTIPDGEHFENAAIVRAEMVRNCSELPEKAPKGYFKDENYVVPLL